MDMNTENNHPWKKVPADKKWDPATHPFRVRWCVQDGADYDNIIRTVKTLEEATALASERVKGRGLFYVDVSRFNGSSWVRLARRPRGGALKSISK
jgi:hypothetical protein